MEIMHHIGFSDTDEIESVLKALSIQFKKVIGPHDVGFVGTLEIAETSPAWPRISELIREKRLLDIAYTLFDQNEVLGAAWVRFTPTNEKGYPQPENNWKKTTLANGCPRCRVGSVQKAPYHIGKEPKMGRFDFMSLYWTYVVFATPRVFAVFSEQGFQGYEEWPVIIHRTGKPAESIRQVYMPTDTLPGLVRAHELQQEVCPNCNQVTLDPVRRDPLRYRREALPEGLDFVRSYEWFGGTGHQEIFISHAVAKTIIENGWRGAKLEPIELI